MMMHRMYRIFGIFQILWQGILGGSRCVGVLSDLTIPRILRVRLMRISEGGMGEWMIREVWKT